MSYCPHARSLVEVTGSQYLIHFFVPLTWTRPFFFPLPHPPAPPPCIGQDYEDGERITSLSTMSFKAKASDVDTIAAAVVGYSSGYVRLFSEAGDLIIEQVRFSTLAGDYFAGC